MKHLSCLLLVSLVFSACASSRPVATSNQIPVVHEPVQGWELPDFDEVYYVNSIKPVALAVLEEKPENPWVNNEIFMLADVFSGSQQLNSELPEINHDIPYAVISSYEYVIDEGLHPVISSPIVQPPVVPSPIIMHPVASSPIILPPVELKVIPRVPDPNSNKVYRLQVGSFSRPDIAGVFMQRLKDAGFETAEEMFESFHRVLAVDIHAMDVNQALVVLGSAGFTEVWIRE
jgi:hypothetical protein